MKRVVIHGIDRKLYLGETDSTVTVNVASELRNAWEIVMIDQHIGNPQTGEILAMKRHPILMPVGPGSGKIPVINVLPGSWYDVDGSGMERDFDLLVKQAETAAVQRQAAEAGLVTAGALPNLTSLKLNT